MDLISEMQTIVYSGTKLDLSYCIDEYIDEEQQEELHDYFIDSEQMKLKRPQRNLTVNMRNLN